MTVTEELLRGQTRTASSSSDGYTTETITNADGSSTSQSTHDGQPRSRTTTASDGSSVYEGLDSDGTADERMTTDADGNWIVALRGADGQWYDTE